ncbi:STB5 [Candida theae]|uniref:STB5 n=1 Tax=Candida theae TaxID=1198502 RepID=A0AAD5BIP7_9ASCO|nr:STB5 [Candida theae]KAI5966667.1 STB5 [Candida theae]
MSSPDSSVSKFRVKKFPVAEGNGNHFSHHSVEQIAHEPVAKVTSCLRCRKLKKKCNKAKPECSNCDKAGEECHYVPRKQRVTKKDKLNIESNGTESTPRETIQSSTSPSMPHHGIEHLSPAISDSSSYSSNQPEQIHSHSARLFHPQLHTNFNMPYTGIEHNQSDLRSITPTTVSQQQQPHHQKAQIEIPMQVPNNNDDAQEFPTMSTPPPTLNAIDARAPSFDAYPKQISKVLYGAVGIKTNSNVSIIPPIIDKVLLTRIMNAFFMHTYRICPVINKAEFLTKFNQMFKDDSDCVSLEEFQDQYELYMVLAIGGTHLERSGIIGREKRISEYFVSMALSSVHNNISKNDIVSMKNLMLLALYSFFNPAEFIVWEIAGKLARMAIHLGLNQAVSKQESERLSVRQIEMRTRLLWSVYTIDRLTSVTLGRPVALHDDDINVPLPQILDDEELDDITTYRLVIHLRQIEGQILRRVHSVNVQKQFHNKGKSEEELREQVLHELRTEIEEWHSKANELEHTTTRPKQSLAFRASIPWFTARYNHLLILLYRPSYLNPQPSQDKLDTLGKACLQTLSSTYKLFKSKSLPLNWTTLYRFLMVCTTILYCLCKWAIDLMESKTEICYCIEIFQAFGSDWVVAKKCAEVFKKIENKLLEITLTDGHTSDMDNLSKELLGASSSYHEILNVHSVDLCIDSQYMYGFES